mgnify:CR=1 FL=1
MTRVIKRISNNKLLSIMNDEGVTILNENSSNTDFAVLELSTKAVKLLIGPQNELVKTEGFTFRDYNENFNFKHFFRTAEKPETGQGLNSEMVMDMNYFNRRVMRAIKKMMSEINHRGINKVVCVATAAYRKAKNQQEILDAIKDQCGINVKVLNKKEEAAATYYAFVNSKPEYIEVDIKEFKGRFLRAPLIHDVPYPVTMEPNLVIEFYSR